MREITRWNRGFSGRKRKKNAKAAIELKYRLLPYIYTYAREAYDTGLPIMRPLFLEYPMDMETFSTDAQFLFGRELLVAPVVKKGARTKERVSSRRHIG